MAAVATGPTKRLRVMATDDVQAATATAPTAAASVAGRQHRWQPFLFVFCQARLPFRLPELDSVLHVCHATVRFDRDEFAKCESPFVVVEVDDAQEGGAIAAVKRILGRSILMRYALELYGSGGSWEACVEAIRLVTDRVVGAVESWCCRVSVVLELMMLGGVGCWCVGW
eukprot:m.457993 g.457993  ORF g.457993 m.457993 type:complete len:170 (-) comp20335_c6_seq5:50-559(-)